MELSSPIRLKEEDLLERPISSLGLKIEGPEIHPLIERLYAELEQKGLSFKPPCFLADEWFCPVGIPAIGIPFYLADRKLRKLEQKYILDVEGGTRSEFMKLIRHETGHAYSYAYLLYKKNAWRKLFGPASKDYPDTYRPRPYSRSFVIHLDNWYAQSHPDEDFAETFAVWLTPGHNWKKRYRGWKALKKIEYVDQLMKSIQGKTPARLPKFRPKEYAGLEVKLKTYFKKKKAYYEESYPDFYDSDLKSLFTDKPEDKSEIRAAQYLKTSYSPILKSVAFATKEKKYTIDQLMKSLVARTKELNLYVPKEASGLDFKITAYVTTLVTSYLFTGKFKRSK